MPTYSEKAVAFDTSLDDDDECKIHLAELQEHELRHKCGGSYIGDGWVITAAHCVKNLPDKDGTRGNAVTDRFVRLGTQTLAAGGETYSFDSIVIHGDYSRKTKLHDIALVRLREEGQTEKLMAQGKLAAIPLMKRTDRAFDDGENLRVTGWGWTGRAAADAGGARRDFSGNVQHYPAQLQQLSVAHQPNSVCEEEYGNLFGIGSICAGSTDNTKFEGSCRGDSGGPLTRQEDDNRVLVGLVSHGKGCGAGIPIVYTRVSHYDGWISAAKGQAESGKVVCYPERPAQEASGCLTDPAQPS